MTKHHPGSRRPPEEPLAADPFLEKTQSAARWAENNRGSLGMMVLALVVVLGGIWYVVGSRARMGEQATLQLEELRGAMMFGDPTTAAADLALYITRFDGTPQGTEASILLGRLHLDQGNPTGAIGALQSAGSDPGDGPLEVQGAFLLAKAYEAAGREAEAEQLYLAISNATDLKFQIWDALAYAAAIRSDRGDLEPAAELYRRILGTIDESDPSRGVYEMRLAEVQARMRS